MELGISGAGHSRQFFTPIPERNHQMTIKLIFAAIAVAAILFACIEIYRRRKMYKVFDEMLDAVLDRETVEVSDLQETELSALANKIIRIQEKMEIEITQAQKEKEQVKSLISNMSHQLKTPLGNVIMYRDLLETNVTNEQREQFLTKMKVQLIKIDWILQSLFKMVKLEQGVILFEAEAVSIRQTLLSAVNLVYDKAVKKQIQIITEPFDDCLLFHNSKWTAEVFSNILENAIKYSDENSRIKIQLIPLELFTEIRISDEGIGIRNEEITDIFKRFYRSREVENKEGSGIGLYLSRLILEQEKGYMTVTSEQGKGSSFSVFLQNVKK